MKIAVDCRYIGKSGIGRVCQGLIDHLDYETHQIYLIGNPEVLQKFQGKAEIIEDLSEPYSVNGLLKFNKKRINKECDAIIIPNFLIPFGLKMPIFSVMHDLIFLDEPISTRGKVDYLIKKTLLKRGMKRSKAVACVSAFTKGRCEHFFGKLADKCYVDHIGLSQSLLEYPQNGAEKTNSIIYVGNVKPHKGLQTLIEAFHALPKGQFQLKIIGERDNFLTGMDEGVLNGEGVVFTGRLGEEELLKAISQASYLVQPSLYEGFGLPPLEAMYLGTKPIVSDIPVFEEVYGDFPVQFFKVKDVISLQEAILSADPALPDLREKITQTYNYRAFTQTIMEKIQ